MDKGHSKLKSTPFAISSDSKFLHYSARFLTVLIAIGAFVLSFNALTALAIAAGITPEFGWMWAASVDGFILIATVAAFVLQRKGKARYYAWTILILFVLLSIFGNGWHAVLATGEETRLPTLVAVLITAIPPITLFLSIHLLVLMIQPDAEQKKMLDRAKRRNERLRAIEEKELERLEQAELRKEIRESVAAQMISGTSVQQQTTAPKPPQLSAPQAIASSISNPGKTSEAEDNTGAVESVLTEEQVVALLIEKTASGEELPSGAAIARMMGKSERTGQNFLKRFKQEHNIS